MSSGKKYRKGNKDTSASKLVKVLRPTNKPKTIEDKLTQRHRDALNAAYAGNYLPLIQVALEAHKAISKAVDAIQLGAVRWGENTHRYYEELLIYLLKHLDNDDARRFYIQQRDIKDGDYHE